MQVIPRALSLLAGGAACKSSWARDLSREVSPRLTRTNTIALSCKTLAAGFHAPGIRSYSWQRRTRLRHASCIEALTSRHLAVRTF
jgi:hypothetical protein